jgi:hypothetical protein
MSEETLSAGGSAAEPAPVCPWCSAALPDAAAERCPSCYATLYEAATVEIPGVTLVDHEALLKRRPRAQGQRSRGLIGWLSGEYQAEVSPELHSTLAPPPDEVRREMLRLELAALEVEAHARLAEQGALAAEAGTAPAEAGILAADAEMGAAGGQAGGLADGLADGAADVEPRQS